MNSTPSSKAGPRGLTQPRSSHPSFQRAQGWAHPEQTQEAHGILLATTRARLSASAQQCWEAPRQEAAMGTSLNKKENKSEDEAHTQSRVSRELQRKW